MYPAVKKVRPDDNHRLLLEFETGEERIFNLAPLLTIGKFRELAKDEEFRKVRVSFDAIAWDNGLDLDPEYLYTQSTAIQA